MKRGRRWCIPFSWTSFSWFYRLVSWWQPIVSYLTRCGKEQAQGRTDTRNAQV